MMSTMLLTLIILGILFMVLMMAFIVNPPEAWVKKVFLKKSQAKKKDSGL